MKLLWLIGLGLGVQKSGKNQAYRKRTILSRMCNVQSCTKCLIAIDGFHLLMPYQVRCLALVTLEECCPMRGLLTQF